MREGLITIYITNYNYGHFIKEAIDSALNQTYKNIEILIIDDGSTDDSKDIIEQYKSFTNLKIIYQQNKGLNITNNIALSLANGEFIMRLDADDYLMPNAVQAMVELFSKNPELGMVFPNYHLVDKSGNTIGEIQRHDFNEHVELYDQPAHGACTLIRTNFLKSVGGYDESYTCQDGYELWIKFISKFKVTNIQESLFAYRQHGENLTTNENKILSTRRNINFNFIEKSGLSTPKTTGIIPLRNTNIKGVPLYKAKIGSTTLLEYKVQQVLSSKKLDKLVLTSHIEKILKDCKQIFSNEQRVEIIERPAEYARYNISLWQTCDYIVSQSEQTSEAVIILPLEFPFVHGKIIDDAINSLAIFGSDSLISVRKEKSTIFQHDGSGMKAIMNLDAYTRLEREALYKNVGGILLSQTAIMNQSKKLLTGKVGHIVVDQKTAHAIYTDFDLKLANFMADL